MRSKPRRRAAHLRAWLSGLVPAARTQAWRAARDRVADAPGPGEPQDASGLTAQLDPRSSGRREIRWSLGTDWFIAVAALHALLAMTLGTLLSPWWIAACTVSFALKTARVRPGEAYLLIPFDNRLEVRRHGDVLKLAGACWMTQGWLVIPTSRRVLPVRRGRLPAQDFARLRRAASG